MDKYEKGSAEADQERWDNYAEDYNWLVEQMKSSDEATREKAKKYAQETLELMQKIVYDDEPIEKTPEDISKAPAESDNTPETTQVVDSRTGQVMTVGNTIEERKALREALNEQN